jgi:2-polyprenyl-6-methoxyphenol hydroxylase-like FAD-dependent oxidoreductase
MFIPVFLSGGGIGGLTLAFSLSKSPDISVDVYEAASKFTEIGAGISLWWRTRQVLKSLGLEEDVIRLLPVRPGKDRGELGLRRLYETLKSRSTLHTISKSRSARRPCHGDDVFSRFDFFSLGRCNAHIMGLSFIFVQVN